MSRHDAKQPWQLFVYGTLMHGGSNHDRFCRGVLSIQPATVRGRLHRLGGGLLMLQVPTVDILAIGTADHTVDAEASQDPAGRRPGYTHSRISGQWHAVPGELLTFDDPAVRIPQLDRLEGYRPGDEPHSFYRRVLLRVTITADRRETTAWCYITGAAFPAMK